MGDGQLTGGEGRGWVPILAETMTAAAEAF